MSSELVPEGESGGEVEDRSWEADLESDANGQAVWSPLLHESGVLRGALVPRTSQRDDKSCVRVAVSSEQEVACHGWGVEENLVLCLEMRLDG